MVVVGYGGGGGGDTSAHASHVTTPEMSVCTSDSRREGNEWMASTSFVKQTNNGTVICHPTALITNQNCISLVCAGISWDSVDLFCPPALSRLV